MWCFEWRRLDLGSSSLSNIEWLRVPSIRLAMRSTLKTRALQLGPYMHLNLFFSLGGDAFPGEGFASSLWNEHRNLDMKVLMESSFLQSSLAAWLEVIFVDMCLLDVLPISFRTSKLDRACFTRL